MGKRFRCSNHRIRSEGLLLVKREVGWLVTVIAGDVTEQRKGMTQGITK